MKSHHGPSLFRSAAVFLLYKNEALSLYWYMYSITSNVDIFCASKSYYTLLLILPSTFPEPLRPTSRAPAHMCILMNLLSFAEANNS